MSTRYSCAHQKGGKLKCSVCYCQVCAKRIRFGEKGVKVVTGWAHEECTLGDEIYAE